MESNIKQKQPKALDFKNVLDPINIKAEKKSYTTKLMIQINPITKEKSEKDKEINQEKKTKKIIPEYPKIYGKTSKNLINIDSKEKEKEKKRKVTNHIKNTIKLDNDFLNKINLYKTSQDKFIFDKKDVIITYYVDGYFTDAYFKLFKEKFYKKNNSLKIIFSYIYTSYEEECDLHFTHKRDNIIFLINDNFKDFREIDKKRILFYPQLNNLDNNNTSTSISNYNEDSIDNSEIFLQQFANFASKNNSNFCVINFDNLKGYRGNAENLDIYLDFILREISSPVIILKKSIILDEDILMQDKISNKKISWLFVFNLEHISSYSILDTCIPFIDSSNDFITGFSLIPTFVAKDDIEKNFKNKMRQMKITDFNYMSIETKKEPYEVINEMVNEGDVVYDFIVIYNKKKFSKQKYVNYEDEYYSNFNVVKFCNSNVIVISGI
jgi:hypothetical protein